jgi:D-alanine-D-alanine ligase
MTFKKIGVLLGGISAEKEISRLSGTAVAAGLRRAGYHTVEIHMGRNLDQQLRDANVDAVYISLHGRWGEDGTVQGMLEVMGIPYTGSSVLASAVVLDKVLTRNILAAADLPVAPGFEIYAGEPIALPSDWQPPIVVKPADEGSSLGISIVRRLEDFVAGVNKALECSNKILVEKFVSGVEITVAVLDGEVLGALEVEPQCEFYDYQAKYEEGGSIHHIPPRINKSRADQCCDMAARAYKVLGCAGAARIDFIVPEVGNPVILEANTSPGMTEHSLLPEIAAAQGLSFDALVSRIMDGARLHVGK